MLPAMPLPSPSEPAAPRRRRRWPRVAFSIFLALIGTVGWQFLTAWRAIRQLEEAGFRYDEARLWKIALKDWQMFFETYPTWGEVTEWDHSENSRGSQLQSFDAIEPSLRRLNPDGIYLILPGCPNLENLDALRGLTALRFLTISSCTSLRNLDGLNGLPQLKYLELYGCRALKDPGAFRGLTRLERLQVSGFRVLQNADGLNELTILEELYLTHCPSLENVDALKTLTKLKGIRFSRCEKLSRDSVDKLRAALPNTVIEVE